MFFPHRGRDLTYLLVLVVLLKVYEALISFKYVILIKKTLRNHISSLFLSLSSTLYLFSLLVHWGSFSLHFLSAKLHFLKMYCKNRLGEIETCPPVIAVPFAWLCHSCGPFALPAWAAVSPIVSRRTELTAVPEHPLDAHGGTGVTLTSLQLYKIHNLCPRMCLLYISNFNMIPKYGMYF